MYDIHYSGSTFSLITPSVAKKFYILPDILYKPFIVSTPVGELVVAKRVYRSCAIM